MRKYLFLFAWLACLPLVTRGQTLEDPDFTALLQPVGVQSVQYWFDEDANSLKTANDLSGNYSFDVSTLEDGLHTVHCLVKGVDGELYGASSQTFLVLKGEALPPHASLEGAQLKYWFDENGGVLQTATGLSGVYTPDVSALADGLHVIHYVVIGADGKAYSTGADTFIKMAEMLNDEVITAVKAKGVTYWFDDDVANKKTSTDLSGTYSLDVSALEDGLHVLHYHVVGEDDLPYGITSTMFLKDAAQYVVHEPARITKYMYWLNNDGNTAKTVTLDKPTSPYTLMSLLPLERMPIRSSVFHFQVDDGVPTIYAKNTFNIRFYDSNDYFWDSFLDNERTYIDYSVSHQVTDAEQLESGQTVTIDRPAENTIKWYLLTAESGDSLEFRLDRAATMQLFSPSGKEVYTVSGAESVKVGGCHVWENGTFYLALHDMTATSGNTIRLNYNHIDKYAVLRQNIKVVGNGGYTTITFEGNGFENLYSIEFENGNGDKINCCDIGFTNNCRISPTFDFTDAILGEYNAIFHFVDEIRTIDNALVVESAKEIKINSKLEYPARVGRGKFKVKIVCPNDGNNTAYDVPYEIRFSGKKGSVSFIDITNPDIETLEELIDKSNLTPEDLTQLQTLSKTLADIYDFITLEWVDENTGEEMETKVIYLLENIPPNSENKIEFDIVSSDDVKTEVNCPIDWLPVYNIEKKKFPTSKEKFCNTVNKIKCGIDGFSNAVDWATKITKYTPIKEIPAIVSCATSTVSWIYDRWSESSCGHVGPKGYSVAGFSEVAVKEVRKGLSFLSPVISCAEKIIPFGELISMVTTVSTTVDAVDVCSNAFSDKESNDIKHMEGISLGVKSWDPNDIYGYTSPSGSKYIGQDVKDVSYTIEFENDPEKATAPAHDIYLTDVLDASKFDLSTYKPTSIRIGDKTAELSGEKNFVTTVDMRPEIYAIAQIEGTFNETTGVINWHISSLDPMTMEPTEELLNGVLPVNTDGKGIGEATFNISLKDGLAHGTEIPNKATIVFDTNEPIETPTWVNTIDAVRPTSHVTNVTQLDNGMAEVTVEAADELSGTWQYDVYVQYGTGSAWMKMAENVPIDTKAKVKVYGGIDHGFYAVVRDQAGNSEEKEPAREASLIATATQGDVNNDGKVDTQDAILVIQHYLGETPSGFSESVSDMNNDGSIDTQDAILIIEQYLNK